MISAVLPYSAFGDKLPILINSGTIDQYVIDAPAIVSILNSVLFDFLARQKVTSANIDFFLVEQLPTLRRKDFEREFGLKRARQIVKDHVLRLTYTAWDMEPFARDMGYAGDPFRWDEEERRHLRARLDALYFHLYGITDEADIRYILSTFPIVERKDRAAHGGVYLTAELIIWYFRALNAGDPNSLAPEAALIRQAQRAPKRVAPLHSGE